MQSKAESTQHSDSISTGLIARVVILMSQTLERINSFFVWSLSFLDLRYFVDESDSTGSMLDTVVLILKVTTNKGVHTANSMDGVLIVFSLAFLSWMKTEMEQ